MEENCSEAKKLIEKYKIGVFSWKVEDVFEINHNFGGTPVPIDAYIQVKERTSVN